MAGRCDTVDCVNAPVARGLCSACYQRDRYRKNPGPQRARKLAHHHRNRARAVAYMRDYGLRRKFGITQAEYGELLAEQDGRCGICRRAPVGTRRLAVDHNHATGRIRGLLCAECNLGLGKFGDDPERLRAALVWLD